MTQTKCWGKMLKRLADAPGKDPAAAAQSVLNELHEKEIIRLTSGSRHLHQEIVAALTGRYNYVPYPAADIPRLGIPGVRFADGPRGAVVGHSTAFPCSMARGATFDPDLEKKVGNAIGKELTAHGANFFGGICVNTLRHPAWGRAQETYGEDSLLLGEMGAALTRSVGKHTATCVKHFACNSMENSRFRVDVRIDEADLRDIYLPHFRRCVDAGVDCVMTAYNKVNGEWCGHHHHLITDILREEWEFNGFVMSDFFFGIRDIAAALNAGLDLEMPLRWRGLTLHKALVKGCLTYETVHAAAFRILDTMFSACARTGGVQDSKSVVCSDKHLALARHAARRSFVLLRNKPVDDQPVLPIRGTAQGGTVQTVALIGRLASLPNTGDLGSSKVRPPHVVTVAEGLEARTRDHGIALRTSLSDNLDKAQQTVTGADVAVVVVGNTWREEGEYVFAYGGDRKQLTLSTAHEQLIQTVAKQCPRTVVVLVGGSAFICESWRRTVPAIMMTWYAGSQGGHAIAQVLLGEHAPAGRLPCTWPTSEEQLPPFSLRAKEFTYGPLHGYRLFHARHQKPAFWFGYGMHYAPIQWGTPEVHTSDSGMVVEVHLKNKADFPQREVVQIYLDLSLGTHAEPLPTLAGFVSVEIPPGEECLARVHVDEGMLSRAGQSRHLHVGRNAGDLVTLSHYR